MEQETTNLYSKKGQIQGSVGAIVYLITGVGVAVLVLIFVGTLGGATYNLVEDKIEEIGNQTAANQAFTAINGTAVSLGNGDIHSGSLVIHNGTLSMNLGNFTIDYPAGTAMLLTNGTNNNTAMTANYTWGDLSIQTSVKGGITSGFEALEQTGDYLPIIVLAVVISLVLTLVLGFTAMGGMSGGGSAL